MIDHEFEKNNSSIKDISIKSNNAEQKVVVDQENVERFSEIISRAANNHVGDVITGIEFDPNSVEEDQLAQLQQIVELSVSNALTFFCSHIQYTNEEISHFVVTILCRRNEGFIIQDTSIFDQCLEYIQKAVIHGTISDESISEVLETEAIFISQNRAMFYKCIAEILENKEIELPEATILSIFENLTVSYENKDINLMIMTQNLIAVLSDSDTLKGESSWWERLARAYITWLGVPINRTKIVAAYFNAVVLGLQQIVEKAPEEFVAQILTTESQLVDVLQFLISYPGSSRKAALKLLVSIVGCDSDEITDFCGDLIDSLLSISTGFDGAELSLFSIILRNYSCSDSAANSPIWTSEEMDGFIDYILEANRYQAASEVIYAIGSVISTGVDSLCTHVLEAHPNFVNFILGMFDGDDEGIAANALSCFMSIIKVIQKSGGDVEEIIDQAVDSGFVDAAHRLASSKDEEVASMAEEVLSLIESI